MAVFGDGDKVEFVPISGGSSITIGNAQLPGTTDLEQSGGVNAPTKRTEEGYDYTTRVNREARTATFDGWVTGDGLSGLHTLRNEKEPFAVAAEHVIMPRATLDNLSGSLVKDAQYGAFEVQVEIREAFQAKAGTSNVEAFATSGKKSGGDGLWDYFAGIGDAAGGGADETVGQYTGATSSGSSTGKAE